MYIFNRNRFLNSVSHILRDKENEQGTEDNRTPAEKERDNIQISGSTDEKANNQNSDDKSSDDESDNKDGEENEETEEGENDDDEEDDENEEADGEGKENETEEEKTARLEKEREDRAKARQQRKFDKLAARATKAEKEAERLRKQLSEQPKEGLSEEEVERRAQAKADEKAREDKAKKIAKQFDDDCDNLSRAAEKIDKDFGNKVKKMADEVAPIPGIMIGILADLDNKNGGAVLAHFTNNLDDYEDLIESQFVVNSDDILIPKSESRLTAKLMRISDKIKEASAKKPTRKSSAAEPIAPINTTRQNSDNVITGKESTEEFIRKRNAQVAERRKAQGYA